MFVATEPVPVTDGTNTIWIKPKMGVSDRNAVQDALIVRAGGQVEQHLGAYNTALLVCNIVRWDGPAFTGTPCTPEAVQRLDPDEPLVEMVLAEIQARNLRRRDPKGKAPSTGGPTGQASG